MFKKFLSLKFNLNSFLSSRSIRDLLINSDYDSDVMPVLGNALPKSLSEAA